MTKFLKQLFLTKLGWIFISFIMSSFFLWLANLGYDWALYAAYPFFGYIAVIFLIMMAYAWVINPIRDRREWKRLEAERQEQTSSEDQQ